MQLISWNVNGLRSACNEGFNDFLAKRRPDIPPDLVLEPEAIEAYGVSSVADLVAALSPQTPAKR